LTTATTDAASSPTALQRTPLHALHVELGARMVAFAGYSMPVQYPSGLMAEHLHTRRAAGLFDVSHMGQLRLVGADSAAALESLMPVDVIDLPVGKQRYGLLLNDAGGIMDDLMLCKRAPAPGHTTEADILVVVNGACKVADTAHIVAKIGTRCQITPLHDHALLALQGPTAVNVLSRLNPGVAALTFMTGGFFDLDGFPAWLTRSGYTGEDGFEISVHADHAEALARRLLADPEVLPIGLGARNSLRLEAGLCLYGQDLDETTTPAEAALGWAVQKVRRTGGARAGGFPGASKVLAQFDAVIAEKADLTGTVPLTAATKIAASAAPTRRRVGLMAQERVPVREHVELFDADGTPSTVQASPVGTVTSGLLGPTVNQPIAIAYVQTAFATIGTRLNAMVRGKPVAMVVCALPFVAPRYHRG
jgi:aminomethyltransferase